MASAQIVLPVARRTSAVEGEREAGGMTLAEAPAVENEIVLRHLRQGGVEGAPGRRRQKHIVECPPRHDRLDRAAAAVPNRRVNVIGAMRPAYRLYAQGQCHERRVKRQQHFGDDE